LGGCVGIVSRAWEGWREGGAGGGVGWFADGDWFGQRICGQRIGIGLRRGRGYTPEEGLDCSGFVRYVFQKVTGMLLPRRSAEISRKGSAVARFDLHPGDLVFFNTRRGEATHVGIYAGEQRFIHAPKKGAVIRVESMKSAYWTARYYGARRVA
jgi:cell wall-associated NlpC family hydrolase